MPSRVAKAIWAIAPGMAICLHREQVLEREMQADAEHQQDDADLGELAGEILVGDKARRERPDDDAGEEIADQRRQLEPVRHGRQDPGECQSGDDGRDEGV